MTFTADVLALTPVSYWRMNETTGTTAVDEKGAHPGTFTQPGLTMGETGGIPNDANKAFRFTGSAAQVITTTGWALSTAAYTVMALVKIDPATPTTFNETIVAMDQDTTNRVRIYARRNATNNRLSYWDNTNTHQESNVTLNPGDWNLVTVRVNGTTVDFFVNGANVGTKTIVAPADVYANVQIGASTTDPMKGWLDEVAIFNKALTDTQIASLNTSWQNNGTSAPATNLELVRTFSVKEEISDNSITITTPADLVVGETLVVSIGRAVGSGSGTISSITGLGSNTATTPLQAIRPATMIAEAFVVPITQMIPAGTDIVATLTGGSPNRKSIVATVWRGLTGVVGSSGVANGASPTAQVVGSSPAIANSTLTIGTFAIGPVDWTADGDSLVAGQIGTSVGTSDRTVVQQYRADAGQTVKSSEGTIPSGSWAGIVMTLPLAAGVAGAPSASAGSPQSNIEPGTLVTLDSSASAAGSGTIASTNWVQTGGAAVTLSNVNAVKPTFTAPYTVPGTTLTFRVTVTNSSGLSNTSTVKIDVLPVIHRVVKKVNGVLTEVPLIIKNHKP